MIDARPLFDTHVSINAIVYRSSNGRFRRMYRQRKINGILCLDQDQSDDDVLYNDRGANQVDWYLLPIAAFLQTFPHSDCLAHYWPALLYLRQLAVAYAVNVSRLWDDRVEDVENTYQSNPI